MRGAQTEAPSVVRLLALEPTTPESKWAPWLSVFKGQKLSPNWSLRAPEDTPTPPSLPTTVHTFHFLRRAYRVSPAFLCSVVHCNAYGSPSGRATRTRRKCPASPGGCRGATLNAGCWRDSRTQASEASAMGVAAVATTAGPGLRRQR